MTRPYTIIHTHTSIDGNILSMDLPEFEAGSELYQDIALRPATQQFNIDAYLNGKISTEDNITHYGTPSLRSDAPAVPTGDFLAHPDAPMYYVSVDPRGELAWEFNSFGYGGVDSHVLEVLTNTASNAYKDFLRRLGISYIIAGESEIDYQLMLEKLSAMGIKRLMVGGGGTINWSFMQQRLVDEVSVVLSPIANGDPNAARFFTAREPYSQVEDRAFELTSVENLGHGVVWLRYVPK
ncbi:dihydrofolate reductase family protein [Corynebacterium sp. S7]